MSEIEKKWYVLRAISGKEAKVKEYLEPTSKTAASFLSRRTYGLVILFSFRESVVRLNRSDVMHCSESIDGKYEFAVTMKFFD